MLPYLRNLFAVRLANSLTASTSGGGSMIARLIDWVAGNLVFGRRCVVQTDSLNLLQLPYLALQHQTPEAANS